MNRWWGTSVSGLGWLAVLLLLVLLSAARPAAGAEDFSPEEKARLMEAVRHYQDSDRLSKQGKVAEAVARLKRCVEILQGVFPEQRFPHGHPALANSLNNLGFLLQAQGELAESQRCYEKALAMKQHLYPKERFPDGHPELASALLNLGSLHRGQGELARAQRYYERALAMYQDLYPKNRVPQGHPRLATCLLNLGEVLQKRGEQAQARQSLERALAMYQALYPRERFPDGHPDLANTLGHLGSLLRECGDPTRAQTCHEQALAMNQRLYPKERFPNGHPELSLSLNNLGFLFEGQDELARAQTYYEQALAMNQRLYPKERFPDGHPALASALNNLGSLLQKRGELVRALSYFEQALAMSQGLYSKERFPNGHPNLASCVMNVGAALQARGELARAQPYLEQALAMCQALYPKERFPNGHPMLAACLNNLGGLFDLCGQLDRARRYHERALAMQQALYPIKQFPNGHQDLARSLANLGGVLWAGGQLARAQTYWEQALGMFQKAYPEEQFPKGHPAVATSLGNLGVLLGDRGEPVRAVAYHERALAMQRKLFPEGLFPPGHPELARTLNNLALDSQACGERARSQSYLEQSLAMQQRLAEVFSELASEAEALNYLAALPQTRDVYLALTGEGDGPSADHAYAHLWRSKGTLLRALVQRRLLLQQAGDLDTARLVEQWREPRRRLAQLTLAPLGKNADAEGRRRLEECGRHKEKLEHELARRLPRLQAKTEPPRLKDLCELLPVGDTLLDLYRYRLFDAKHRKWQGYRYAAFVLRKDQPVRRIELGDAETVEAALKEWLQVLAAQGRHAEDSPSVRATRQRADEAAQRLHRLLWQPLSALLGTARHIWVSPEGPLAALPFAALPGSKSGSILLEEHSFAVIPHPAALLDWLKESDAGKGDRLLLVGDVDYGSPGKPWKPLSASGRERDELARLAQEQARLRVTTLGGTEADSQSVLEQLRRARFAHLATHGYFAADDSQERERLYQQADLGRMSWGERVGTAARNPLTLSGLVLAGANRGKGEGLLTAEALAGEDLHGLELAVLSACQTGLGEAAAGEGVFGLQRALHLAGARNVVASLWRVDDEATAALMALFYRNLWQHKLAPAEALRQAQLTLYRHPEAVKGLAQTRGPDFDQEYERVAKGQSEKPEAAVPTKKGSRLGAKFWAGFVLSGPGR